MPTSYCGGRLHTAGSSFHTPRQRRHSHQSPAEPSPRLRTSVLPQRTHETGRCGSVERRPPRSTFRRSGIAGLRRSISGQLLLTLGLYPDEDGRIDLGISLTRISVKGAQIWEGADGRERPRTYDIGVDHDAFHLGSPMRAARVCRYGLAAFLAWLPACTPTPAPPSEADVTAIVEAFYGGSPPATPPP